MHAACCCAAGDRRPAPPHPCLPPAGWDTHPNPVRHRRRVLGPQHVDLPIIAWLSSLPLPTSSLHFCSPVRHFPPVRAPVCPSRLDCKLLEGRACMLFTFLLYCAGENSGRAYLRKVNNKNSANNISET